MKAVGTASTLAHVFVLGVLFVVNTMHGLQCCSSAHVLSALPAFGNFAVSVCAGKAGLCLFLLGKNWQT